MMDLNNQIDEETQKNLGKPLQDPTGASDEDKQFLDLVIKLINEGKIDVLNPNTLINKAVYSKLDEATQGKTDLEAVNLLSAIREIKGLYDGGFQDSFQMQNLVSRLRLTKERLEDAGGDLFII